MHVIDLVNGRRVSFRQCFLNDSLSLSGSQTRLQVLEAKLKESERREMELAKELERQEMELAKELERRKMELAKELERRKMEHAKELERRDAELVAMKKKLDGMLLRNGQLLAMQAAIPLHQADCDHNDIKPDIVMLTDRSRRHQGCVFLHNFV